MHKMKKIKLLLIMGLFGLFGCKQKTNEQKTEAAKSNVKIDKTVKQKIFEEEVVFYYSDFEDLKNNKYYDQFEIGTLSVPTGQIVCTDPMYRELGLPQSWAVKPGKYPVNIYIGLEEDFSGRVAYSEITFSQNKPVRWEMSLIDEELLADDFEKKTNGMYPVENGLSSFSDYSIWQKYNDRIKDFKKENPEGNFYNEVLDSLFKKNVNTPASSRGEDWINFQLEEDENIIMFGSGWGDGLYPRYVAFDSDNEPVKLITDFIQLQYEE